MWDDEDETRPPMTDAEYAVWHEEVKARIARSLADPRPALTIEQVREHFRRRSEELKRAAEGDAAA